MHDIGYIITNKLSDIANDKLGGSLDKEEAMKLRLPILATVFALMTMLAITPTAFAASPTATSASAPVSGTIANGGGTFTGTLSNIVFSNVNGVLTATGTLSGTLTNAAGATIGTVSNLAISVAATAAGTCQILNLTLGPLDLNLLGLMVHLNQVVLNITAQSGPGNLLGNLLCAVAHLLDSNASVTALANLLNSILGQLGI